jgi:hypothetical protein
VISKVKCDNGRPCKRCQKKNLQCLTQSPRPSQAPVPGGTENLLSGFPYVSESPYANNSQLDDLRLQEQGSAAQALLDLYNTTDYCQQNIPAFFDQIMVSGSDYMSLEYMQPPPDLTAWMPDVEWPGQYDIFGHDFTPTVDQMFETQTILDVHVQSTSKDPQTREVYNERVDSSSAKRRHAVFKQSPWYVKCSCIINRN